MTETKKESLSALIDGEASEIEVHRLVREFRGDESLSRTWAIYQHIRTTVQTGSGSGSGGPGFGSPGFGKKTGSALTPDEHLSLFDSINTAVLEEDTFEKSASKSSNPTRMIAGSLALAASLVVAVFIGVQQSNTGAKGTVPVVAAAEPLVNKGIAGQPVNVTPASNQPVYAQNAPAQTLQSHELVELDEEKQKRLRAYLNQHDRMARMSPNTQLVNYKEAAGN